MVAMYLMMDTGLMAPVRAWLRRPDRLPEGRARFLPVHTGTYCVYSSDPLAQIDSDP